MHMRPRDEKRGRSRRGSSSRVRASTVEAGLKASEIYASDLIVHCVDHGLKPRNHDTAKLHHGRMFDIGAILGVLRRVSGAPAI